jgi:hypothetical protein
VPLWREASDSSSRPGIHFHLHGLLVIKVIHTSVVGKISAELSRYVLLRDNVYLSMANFYRLLQVVLPGVTYKQQEMKGGEGKPNSPRSILPLM